jgi:hypothetical protein
LVAEDAIPGILRWRSNSALFLRGGKAPKCCLSRVVQILLGGTLGGFLEQPQGARRWRLPQDFDDAPRTQTFLLIGQLPFAEAVPLAEGDCLPAYFPAFLSFFFAE